MDALCRVWVHHGAVLSDLFPILGQLRSYRLPRLRGDALAGLTAAATLIPQALAYGQQAGLPPAAGLYTVVGAAVAFALFTSTRTVAVGPSSTTAMITFAVVHAHAGGDPERAMTLAAALSMLAGLVWFLAAALRLSVIAEFLSQPVLLGYLAGTAVVVVSSQAGKLVGVHVEGKGSILRLWGVFTHLGQAHLLTTALAVMFIVLYVLLRRYVRAVPASLAVVAIAIVVSTAGHLERHGVALVGKVSGGLPVPALPFLSAQDLWMLTPAAVGLVLIASTETAAAERRTAGSGQRLQANRELAAMGTASVGAGLLGGFPPMASTSRSVSMRSAGAQTQVFQLVVAGLAVGTLLAGGPVIARLPVVALAVVAIFSALKLVDRDGFRAIWRGWRYEGVLALLTALGVATLGVLWGMLVGVALAMWDLVRRAARPHDAVLTLGSGGAPPHPIDEQEPTSHPHVLIYRVDAPVFFANANHVHDRILALATARGPRLRYVILDAGAMFYLDATAAAMLARLTLVLRERGCQLLIARARDTVAQTLHASSYEHGATQNLPTFPGVRDAYAATEHRTSQD
jgi:high affinity sulfate transporter 1